METQQNKKCQFCGEEILTEAKKCKHCGEWLEIIHQPVKNSKSKVVALLLAWILGGLGAHKFYLGKTGQGILYLLFCWTFIPSIIAFFEGIGYIASSDEKFASKYVYALENNSEKKESSFKKVLLAVILAVVAFSILMAVIGDKMTDADKKPEAIVQKNEASKQSEVKTDDEKRADEEVKKKAEIERLKTQLTSETEAIKKFNGGEYRESVEKINAELMLFSVWAILADTAKNNDSDEIKKLGKNLETSLVALQNKEFPQMRLAWGKLLKTKLWEFNVDISVLGNKNTVLEIVGAYYASNKNIKDTQATISDMLKSLRFDRVNYRWYEYDDGYYFTIESKKDNELEILK